MSILEKIYRANTGRKQLAVLVDPDKSEPAFISEICTIAEKYPPDYFFTGGSLVFSSLESCVISLRNLTQVPIVLFPGNVLQICPGADAILFLSLISGRNPEFLIGHHVLAAPVLKKTKLEVIPTAYILIENGHSTSVQYMSNTSPIPFNKPEIAVATAMAGEMLGLKLIYLEAGSGAAQAVGLNTISEVKKNTTVPLIVGGGIKNGNDLNAVYKAGADLVVVGTAVEENPEILKELIAVRDTI